MNFQKVFQITALGLLLNLSLSVPAQAGPEAAPKFFEDAQAHYSAGEYKAAIIQLKNALQHDPKHLSSHILMGAIRVEQSDGAGAESALRMAQRLGADRKLTTVPMARALLLQGQYKKLLKELEPEGFPTKVQAALLVERGQAYLELMNIDAAYEAFSIAVENDPVSARAIAGKATVLIRQGQLADAKRLAAHAVTLAPDDASVWNVKASIPHLQGELQAAVQQYSKAIELNALQLDARLARVGLYLDLKQFEAAARDLDFLQQEFPLEPRAAYLRSVLSNRIGDTDGAQQALSEAIAIIETLRPQYVFSRAPILLVAGLANYGGGHFEKSRVYLTRYIEKFPGQPGPRKLLGAILMKDGAYRQAISVMEAALKYAPKDHRLLTQLGTAHMRAGHHDVASTLLERAVDLSGGASDVRAQLAYSRLASGDHSSAVEELNAVLAQDPDALQAGITLIVTHLKQRNYAPAVKIASALSRRNPKDTTLLNLLATAYIGIRDYSQARLHFERAIALDENFLAAQINLGKVDRLEGKLDQALDHFRQLLNAHPDNTRLLLELARVQQARGQQGLAILALEKARAHDSRAIPPRLVLAEIFIKEKRNKQALKMAIEAEAIDSQNLKVLSTVGRAHLANKRPDLARVMYGRMAKIARFDAPELYKIANLQLHANDTAGAIWSLRKATQGDPTHVAARAGLSELLLAGGNDVGAEEQARALLERFPKRAIGEVLLGDVLRHRRAYQTALQHYQSALRREPTSRVAIRVFQTWQLRGDLPGAISFLTDWVGKYPQDRLSRQALAEAYLRQGDLDEARSHYETILRHHPASPSVLNNLANIHLKTGSPKALAIARQAYTLGPQNPSASDTLGWVLVRQGQPEEGLKYLRDAYSRLSDSPEIAYHIAVALNQLGRKAEAIKLLDEALASGRPFGDLKDARALKQRLAR